MGAPAPELRLERELRPRRALLPLAWTVTGSLALLAAIGVKYFAVRVGAVFGVVAVLSGAGAVLLAAG